jgi:CRISPR/Cas system-associated endoribonuclease Cas2
MPRLHWIQNSVFAGELTQVAAVDLRNALTSSVKKSKVGVWLFDRKPEVFNMGAQDDGESIFF